MKKLISLLPLNNIPEKFKDTPIEKLMQYHNLAYPYETYEKAELLIGMCMDHRKNLKIPDRFSFIMRSGGANFRFNEFHISFALSVPEIRHFVLIGHTDCGMVNIPSKKEAIIKGLVNIAGWTKESAEDHYEKSLTKFEVHDERTFILEECLRLRKKYPAIIIAPMIYTVENNKLYFIKEN